MLESHKPWISNVGLGPMITSIVGLLSWSKIFAYGLRVFLIAMGVGVVLGLGASLVAALSHRRKE
jgi:hypothetical protein